ncbi:hypothetical protein GL263_23365 [Streptomyces durbertensis]|uniref:DUF5709 domain-containing protein n=1 Tax=Streptomyces durbertensis TaxID=2448886 RepID=A0ABR6EM90_9ACTN|nr:hypothetical protein [Streptomyces durbertensis]MBB1246468.1 hypothetical protein [Streptomyces durbertensis]
MPVDPSNPDTYEDVNDADYGVTDPEAPEADTAEQRAEVMENRDVPLSERELVEADPADAAEQARVVELDEDDYR